MRPRRLLRLLSDFNDKIRYHPGKASIATDALSRNERAKPLKVPSDESERNMADPSVVVFDSSVSDYDSVDESSVCSNALPLLEKLVSAEPISRPKTIKLILKSNSIFKAEILKSIIINEPSLAPAKGNISTLVSTTIQHLLVIKECVMEDGPPLAIVIKELDELKLQISKNKYISITLAKSDDCVYYPTCELCGSYDHDTHGHNMIISLRRGIKPRNPQHVTKNCETCGSNVHTKTGHNNIKWYRKREALQTKKVKTFKTSKTESSSALRSKTPTKRSDIQFSSCLYARYQANPKEFYLIAEKRIFQVLTQKDAQTLTMLNATWTKSALQVFVSCWKPNLRAKVLKACNLFSTEHADTFTSPLDEPTFKRLIVELKSSQIQQQDQTERPANPIPFALSKQIGFNLEDIFFNTNNEVALLYPEHSNKETLKCVSDFISKCCLREPFTRSPNMFKEYLAKFWYSSKARKHSKVSFSILTGGIYGKVRVNTFRNAICTHYLPHSSEYVAPPSIDIVRPWFETIGYVEKVPAKGTLKKSLLPPR
ncbi:hypothetical protein Tco_1419942 [Tanacetum coccineum]